jgi:hypothetical protein
MNDDYSVPACVIIDDIVRLMNYTDDVRAMVSAAEVLTVAVVAARYFQNHHERAGYPATTGRQSSSECVAFQSPPARAARRAVAVDPGVEGSLC